MSRLMEGKLRCQQSRRFSCLNVVLGCFMFKIDPEHLTTISKQSSRDSSRCPLKARSNVQVVVH